MVRPHSGGTAYLITVAPVPGKYASTIKCSRSKYNVLSIILVCRVLKDSLRSLNVGKKFYVATLNNGDFSHKNEEC